MRRMEQYEQYEKVHASWHARQVKCVQCIKIPPVFIKSDLFSAFQYGLNYVMHKL